MNRVQVGMKDTSVTATVPNHYKAKLMYYFHCIGTVLELENNGQLRRLRDYKNYWSLDEEDTNALLALCLILSPDKLMNKCIFMDEDMCGDRSNRFFELSAVSNTMVVSRSIMINGRTSRVTNIMTFTRSWLRNNFMDPLEEFQRIQQRQVEAAESRSRQRRRSSSCAIL